MDTRTTETHEGRTPTRHVPSAPDDAPTDWPPDPLPLWKHPLVRRALIGLFLAAVAWLTVWLGLDPETIIWPAAP